MKEITDKNFGVIIAFWLPGFLLLWGLSYSSHDVAAWLVKANTPEAPTVAGFLYATVASLALGLLVSAIRWCCFDWFLSRGLPDINFAKLKDKDIFVAFNGLVENHYRYYQYYSNTLVAIIVGFSVYAYNEQATFPLWCIIIVIGFILLLASRDSLKKYRERAAELTS
jgi:hypothetical protein